MSVTVCIVTAASLICHPVDYSHWASRAVQGPGATLCDTGNGLECRQITVESAKTLWHEHECRRFHLEATSLTNDYHEKKSWQRHYDQECADDHTWQCAWYRTQAAKYTNRPDLRKMYESQHQEECARP